MGGGGSRKWLRNLSLTSRKALLLSISFTSLLLFLNLPSSPHHFSPFSSSSGCISLLHRISWTRSPAPAWSWDEPTHCGFRRFSKEQASELLTGAWILAAGDSQARLLVLALLRILLDPDQVSDVVEPDLFRRHSNYQLTLPDRGIKVDFVWAPYESNITHLLQDIRLNPHYPDLVILGSGLWHMLHITNPEQYGTALFQLNHAAKSLLEPLRLRPHMFWLGLPKLVNSRLNTEEKRGKMSDTVLEAYDKEVDKIGMLMKSGGPFVLLDIGILTRGCGVNCASDGMHYDSAVYNAAVNIMLNGIMVESR